MYISLLKAWRRPDVTEGCATALIPFRPGQWFWFNCIHWEWLKQIETLYETLPNSFFVPGLRKCIISKSSIMKSWMALSCHDCNSEPGPSHLEQVEVYRHDLMTSRHPRPQLPCLRTLAHSGAIKKCQMVVAVSVASIHFKVSLSQNTLFRPLRVAPRSSSSSKMRLTWHSSWFRGMHRRPRPNKYNKSQGVVQQILGSHINEYMSVRFPKGDLACIW